MPYPMSAVYLRAMLTHVMMKVKSLGKPPYGVKLTMEATCIMFGIKPDKMNDPDHPGKKARRNTERILTMPGCGCSYFVH